MVRSAMVEGPALAKSAKSWLAKSPNRGSLAPFFAVFLDWHGS